MKGKREVDFSDVFLRQVAFGSRVLLEGRPGSGKSTLMNKISQDWAKGLIMNNVELLLLVPLRMFFGVSEIDLKQILGVFCPPVQAERLYTQICRTNGRGVCFAFDGLDEYSPANKKQDFVFEMIKGNQLTESVIIVASRPGASQKFRRKATSNIEVLGFLKPQIAAYVTEYYETEEEAQKLLAYLQMHPNIHHMCYLPLHAAMIACLFDRMGSLLPSTETEIYYHFTLYTLIRALLQLLKKGDQHSEPCLQLTCFEQLQPVEFQVFTNICQLAFEATAQQKQTFTHDEVKDFFPANSGSDTENSLGLVTIDRHPLLYGPSNTYSYLHLTFQEFLGAYHVSTLEKGKQVELVKRYHSKRHMHVIWKFFCGISKLSDGSKLECYSEIIQSNHTHSLLHLHCAYEAQSESACNVLVSTGSGAIKVHKETLTPSDMTAIAYVAVKACTVLKEISMTSCHIGKEGFLAASNEVPDSGVSLSNLRWALLYVVSHSTL